MRIIPARRSLTSYLLLPEGHSKIGHALLGRWETITFAATLRHNKMRTPWRMEKGPALRPAVLGSETPIRDDIVMTYEKWPSMGLAQNMGSTFGSRASCID